MREKSAHDELRDRIAKDYIQKGYHVSTEKAILYGDRMPNHWNMEAEK